MKHLLQIYNQRTLQEIMGYGTTGAIEMTHNTYLGLSHALEMQSNTQTYLSLCMASHELAKERMCGFGGLLGDVPSASL